MIRVLFVCLGNICRSPMAEAVFQQKISDAGLSAQIQVDSAATSRWEVGKRAHPGTLNILERHNINYNGRARQIRTQDLQIFDYILAMDRSNYRDLQHLAKGTAANITMFLSYANEAGTVTEQEVPDPYYDGRFEYVYDLVSKGCDALLANIRESHNL